jgi:hypothetical protein
MQACRPAAAGDVSWLADAQRPPDRLPEKAPRLKPLLVDDQGRPLAGLPAWEQKREHIRRWWLDYLKPWPRDAQKPPALEVLAEDRPGDVVRRHVRYEVEPGVHSEAYVLKPAAARAGCPGAVVLHSTVNHTIRQPAGLEGPPEKAFGLKLAQRGYVTICPRNFLWTADGNFDRGQVERSATRHPGSKGMAKMLHDAQVVVDILAGLPEVDPKRLGAVGHSLGAKEVLYLAAFDERIRATASSEGGIGTRFCNWDAPWYLGEEVRGETFGHEHEELLALVAPRAFLLLGGDKSDGDHSWPFIEAALPVYKLYGEVARLALVNHRKGHSVPPEAERAIYDWFAAYC